MAIYHNSSKIIGRSQGRSSVGASAYRSGEKLYNEYDGIEHDYTKKTGVVYSEIVTPPQAKEEFKNREVLWNQVEKIEKSKDSQLAREVEVSLPKEFTRTEQIELVKSYVQDNFVKNGMCADLNIHDKGDGNPHAHIMLTMREIKENGEWGAKQEKLYLIRKQGEKDIYVNSKVAREKVDNEGYEKVKQGNAYKTKSVDFNNWNSKEFLQSYREDWANKINQKLKEIGINERVDHRSFKEQGIEKLPTKHEGYVARAMEKRGIKSERMEINRQINSINERISQFNIEVDRLKKETIELNKNSKQEINFNSMYENLGELEQYRRDFQQVSGNLKALKDGEELKLTNHKMNREDIQKLQNLIIKENDRRKNLGLFKRTEKKNCDDRINKYSSQIETLKNSLLSQETISEINQNINEINKKLDKANEKVNNYNDEIKNQKELLMKQRSISQPKDKSQEHHEQNNRNRRTMERSNIDGLER